MSRHRQHPLRLPLMLFLAVVALNLAASVLWAAYQLLPWLLLAAAAVLAWRAARTRPLPPGRPPRVIQGHADATAEDRAPTAEDWAPPAADNAVEVIRLRAEVEALRAERDHGQEAARAAWEASSEPAPDATATDIRSRLLRDPRSGAHPLGGA